MQIKVVEPLSSPEPLQAIKLRRSTTKELDFKILGIIIMISTVLWHRMKSGIYILTRKYHKSINHWSIDRTIHLKLRFFMHIRLLVISLLALSFSAFAKPAFIEVNAKAQVQALPDFIQISVSIEKVGKNSADAKTATDSSSEALNALLKNEGIKDEDIEQARLSIYPDYQWHQGKRSLQGYKASRSVQIKLRDLDSYNEFMQKLSGLNLQRVVFLKRS